MIITKTPPPEIAEGDSPLANNNKYFKLWILIKLMQQSINQQE